MWTHSNQKSVLALQLFNFQYFVASLGEKTPNTTLTFNKKKKTKKKSLYSEASFLLRLQYYPPI